VHHVLLDFPLIFIGDWMVFGADFEGVERGIFMTLRENGITTFRFLIIYSKMLKMIVSALS
jgi:hypothetical protein